MAIETAQASFTGAEDYLAVTWADVGNSSPTILHGVEVNAGDDIPTVAIDAATISATGCTVIPSARFTGKVNLVVIG